MAEDGFDLRELERVNQDIIDLIARKYPKSAKALMDKQGNAMRQKLRARYKSEVGRKTGKLQKGITKSAAYTYGDSYQVRVRNKAPHAHLIEHGHVFYHQGKKTEKWVEGRHVAARAMEDYRSAFAQDVNRFVDEILEEGFS